MENNSVNEQLLLAIKKQNFWLRLMGAAMTGLFLVILVVALILVPQATSVMSHAAATLEEADVAVSELNKTAHQLSQIDFEGLVDETRVLITQSSEGINEAIGKLDDIDIDGLNKAIGDLGSVVSPLAGFFRR